MSLPDFPLGETTFLIDGPAGKLEVLTLSPKEEAQETALGVAVICHPHPLHQGAMHNKVVHTLSRAFHNKGLHTIRFNFRGVGKSEGAFGHSIGEVEDLTRVIAWARSVLPDAPLWLAGFSFGAYIAAKGATLHSCQQLYSIAPAVPNQPYVTLDPIDCPWIVVQGGKDEVIDPDAVYTWFDITKLQNPKMQLIDMPEATHFFHGGLALLRNKVEETVLLP